MPGSYAYINARRAILNILISYLTDESRVFPRHIATWYQKYVEPVESMERIKPPLAFSFEGNTDQAWKAWIKHFNFYLYATESNQKSDKVKTCMLLSCIGEKGREIYDTFEFDPATEEQDPSMTLDVVVTKFQEYCSPRKNKT